MFLPSVLLYSGTAVRDAPDIWALAIILLAFFTSQELAHAIAPYAAIFICSMAGAGLSLSGSSKSSTMTIIQKLWYVLFRILIAITLTVSVAELFQQFAAWLKPRYTLIPLAFFIGWIEDYGQIRTKIGEIIERLTNMIVSKKVDGEK